MAILDHFKVHHASEIAAKDKLIEDLKLANQLLQQQITDLQMDSGVVPKSGKNMKYISELLVDDETLPPTFGQMYSAWIRDESQFLEHILSNKVMVMKGLLKFLSVKCTSWPELLFLSPWLNFQAKTQYLKAPQMIQGMQYL